MRRGRLSLVAALVAVALLGGCSLLVHLGEEEPSALDAGVDSAAAAADSGPSATTTCEAGTLAFDPDNCGACGHRCCGMTCLDGGCVFASGSARRIESDDQPTTIARDPDDGAIYWTRREDGGNALVRLDVGASAPSTVVTGLPYLRDIVAGDGSVFLSASSSILRVPTTSAAATAMPIVTSGAPYGLALAGGMLWWADGNGAIRRAMTDGSGTVTLYAGRPANGPYAIAVDDSRVAWTEAAGGYTVAVGLVDGGPSVVYPQANNDAPGPVAIDDAGVYWGDLNVGQLVSIPSDGGAPVTLVPAGGAGSITGIAVDDTYIYWILLSKDDSVATGTLSAIGRDGSHPQVLAPNLAGPKALVASDSCLYWVDEGLDTTAYTGGATPSTGNVMSIEKPPPPAPP